MIKVNDEVIRVEHFPDGTQKLSIESIWNASGSYGIDWRDEKDEELSTLIFVTRHLRNTPYTKSVELKMNWMHEKNLFKLQLMPSFQF